MAFHVSRVPASGCVGGGRARCSGRVCSSANSQCMTALKFLQRRSINGLVSSPSTLGKRCVFFQSYVVSLVQRTFRRRRSSDSVLCACVCVYWRGHLSFCLTGGRYRNARARVQVELPDPTTVCLKVCAVEKGNGEMCARQVALALVGDEQASVPPCRRHRGRPRRN